VSGLNLYEIDSDGCIKTWVAASRVADAINAIDAVDEFGHTLTIRNVTEDASLLDAVSVRNDDGPGGGSITMREAFRQACVEMGRTKSAAAIVASTEW
jgi:hypothetical protein